MLGRSHVLVLALAVASGCDDAEAADAGPPPAPIEHRQGELAGEVTASSAALQTRLTTGPRDRRGDVAGVAGWARFEIDDDPGFADPVRTEWTEATADGDFLVRATMDELAPGTRYHYRAVLGASPDDATAGPTRTFVTLPAADADAPVRFVVASCLHYDRFLTSDRGRGPDGALGYPGLAAIEALDPDFVIFDGDVVYYDFPPDAQNREDMRAAWHRQRSQPRMVSLLGSVATFWMKDDHDWRFDDADPFVVRSPDAALGTAVFAEQVPAPAPAYRTHRVGRHLQIWMLESREHRSANDAPDDADKSLWGAAQRGWLRDGLLSSDATFRVIVTPTPLVGPDDARKNDNHTNEGGFRTEGEAFLAWARDEGLPSAGLVVITGDRHWQYHSVHPTGVEEVSVGALVEGNARLGVAPGDPEGTDPDGLVDQRFTNAEVTGGFALVTVTPGAEVALRVALHDEDGVVLYETQWTRPAP